MSTLLVWALILVPVALGFAVRRSLNSTFARYRQVPSRAGANGAAVARALLDAHGLERVRVEVTPGTLSDHYDPQAGALRLSGEALSLAYVAGLVLFALATLPVEFGASRRALRLLRETRLAADDELREDSQRAPRGGSAPA